MNKRYIHITKADRDFIAKALNVTEKTVYNAIRFDDRRGNSELSAKIRKLAMDLPCGSSVARIRATTARDCATFSMVMRQYCPDGALIELDRNDGSGQVIFKGETVKTYEHVMVADINQIQAFASALR